jgi:Site-specific recombinases, DNA invertase Pin homologs
VFVFYKHLFFYLNKRSLDLVQLFLNIVVLFYYNFDTIYKDVCFDTYMEIIMPTIYGYCRISTSRQNIERQVRNIKEKFPDALIVKETYSGRYLERPKFDKLLTELKKGDTVIFDSVSRMSRNAKEGSELYEKLFNENINLVFLKEVHINTEIYRKALQTKVPLTGMNVDLILEGINKYLMVLAREQIQLAFDQSEKEVQDLRLRTREGMKTASLNGKQIGIKKGTKLITKKSIKAKSIILKKSRTFNGNNTDVEVMKLAGIAKGTYYKYKKELINLEDNNG